VSGEPEPGPLRPIPVPFELVPPPTDGGGGTTLLASKLPVGVPAAPAVWLVPPPVVPSDGGGGTTLGAPRVGAVEEYCDRLPAPPETPEEDGGAITFGLSAVLAPLREPRRSPATVFPVDDGGGGTTLGASVVAGLPVLAPLELTAGGGGTTSEAPKIFPTRLLRSDPLPDCVGGGGTTALEVSAVLPFARRRMSREMSEEGGGAMTAGDGNVSLGSRALVRSGAETGGGTTATLAICTGELET
jgi:hypothetical protein